MKYWFFVVLFAFGLMASDWSTDKLLAADWLQFRGAEGNGAVKNENLPTMWSESKSVRWFAKLAGLGWSSPVVVGNRIYVTTSVAAEEDSKALSGAQQLRLICLDSRDGHVIFDHQVLEQGTNAPNVHKKNSHASPTPVVDGDRIFLHFGHQGTVATDLEGKTIWTNRDNPYPPTHGNGSSPVVFQNLLMMTCDGGEEPCTRALDKLTGKEVWRTPRGVDADKKFSFCTPSIIKVDGQEQLISAGSNVVQSLDPQDGSILWLVRYDGYSVVPRPIFHQGLVFLCTGFGPTTLLAIDPKGKGDVTESHVRWKYKSQNVPKTSSLIAYQNQIIMSSDGGIGAAVDSQTGEELWKLRLGGGYSASPMLNGDLVYFHSEEGNTTVMRLGTEPVEVAKNSLPGRTFASFAIVDNDLLIRAEGGLYRIGQ